MLLAGGAVWGESGLALRRLVRAWSLFGPLVFEYKVFTWWARYCSLTDEQKSMAYRRLHEKYAPLVFSLLAEQGGVFVKIGQLLSLLPEGVLPDQFTKELKKLQNACPPREGSEVRRLVSDSLGRPLEEVFSHFEDSPLGSASIGQVHKARVAADGREVVVKVQYPEVSRTVELDFTTCEWVVWFLDKTRVEEVRQTKTYYIKELDFGMEAATLHRVHTNLRGPFPAVRVPEPILQLCTPTVLVMTFISGSSLLDSIMQMADTIAKARGQTVDQLIAEFTQSAGAEQAAEAPLDSPSSGWSALRSKLAGLVPSLPNGAKVQLLLRALSVSNAACNTFVALYNGSVARLGASPMAPRKALPAFSPTELSYAIWRVHGHQLLVDGIFSTDPHPGNIVVGDGADELGLIDFGQVCELRLETRVTFARLLLALAAEDDMCIARRHADLGYRTQNMSMELLALTARMKYGDASVLRVKAFRQYRELSAADPVLSHAGDEGLGRAERMINVLRGTSLVLGVPYAHGPTTVWLDMAQALVSENECLCDPYGDDFYEVLDEECVFADCCAVLDLSDDSPKTGIHFRQ
uniref:ABC1 atypical kinase-like domain-containing protein n=1 Tax=Zooxanthella nutricula TaxID=1333877 RepID=A0A7S2ICG3_9DINO